MSETFNLHGLTAARQGGVGAEDGSFLSADRQPCIICGHPSGDCDTLNPGSVKIVFSDAGTVHDSLKQVAKILVEEDVFEERQITPFTKIKIRIAKKGSYVTLDRAKKLGILGD